MARASSKSHSRDGRRAGGGAGGPPPPQRPLLDSHRDPRDPPLPQRPSSPTASQLSSPPPPPPSTPSATSPAPSVQRYLPSASHPLRLISELPPSKHPRRLSPSLISNGDDTFRSLVPAPRRPLSLALVVHKDLACSVVAGEAAPPPRGRRRQAIGPLARPLDVDPPGPRLHILAQAARRLGPLDKGLPRECRPQGRPRPRRRHQGAGDWQWWFEHRPGRRV